MGCSGSKKAPKESLAAEPGAPILSPTDDKIELVEVTLPNGASCLVTPDEAAAAQERILSLIKRLEMCEDIIDCATVQVNVDSPSAEPAGGAGAGAQFARVLLFVPTSASLFCVVW